MFRHEVCVIFSLCFSLLSAVHAEKTYTVKEEKLNIEKQFHELVRPSQYDDIKIKADVWKDFKVVQFAKHGSKVNAGDVLLKLDDKKLKEAIVREEIALTKMGMDLNLMENDLVLSRSKLEFDLKNANYNLLKSENDLQYFLIKGKAKSIEDSKFAVKASKQRLDYAKEELYQLEKMYKEDDLTEETEEIILKRQKNNVEAGEKVLADTREKSRRFLEVEVKRKERAVKNSVKPLRWALERLKKEGGVGIKNKEFAIQLKKMDIENKKKHLSKLKNDLEFVTIKSPSAGLVYHGRFGTAGWKFSDLIEVHHASAKPLPTQEAIMTVINNDACEAQVKVKEEDIRFYKQGGQGWCSLISNENVRAKVSIVEVSPFPVSAGVYAMKLSIEKNGKIVPGVKCKFHFNLYEKDKALMVPEKVLFLNPETLTYELYTKEGDKTFKLTPVIGEKKKDKIEILSGIKKGDKVLFAKPQS